MKSLLKEIENKFITLEKSELCKECGMHECICVNEAELCKECGMHECTCIDEATMKKDLFIKLPPEEQEKLKDVEITAEEIEEASTASAAGEYMTPKSFISKSQYKKGEKKFKWASVSEAMDKKYESLIESYSKFAMGKGPKSSPSRTVNETIRQVSKRLHEIETLINYTGKLKKESGMTRAEYGKSTFNALNKISERLLKISERVRSLGE